MDPGTYMIAFAAMVLLAVLVFRVLARSEYRRHGRLTLIGSAAETLVFVLWGFFTWADLPPRFPPSEISAIQNAAAWVLIAGGLAGMAIVITWFGWQRAFGRNVTTLQQSGPYKFSRNPQVVICFLAVLGYALLWPSWHSLGWILLYAVLAHLMVRTEEEHLKRVFGDLYEEYCRSVPRYVGLYRRGSA